MNWFFTHEVTFTVAIRILSTGGCFSKLHTNLKYQQNIFNSLIVFLGFLKIDEKRLIWFARDRRMFLDFQDIYEALMIEILIRKKVTETKLIFRAKLWNTIEKQKSRNRVTIFCSELAKNWDYYVSRQLWRHPDFYDILFRKIWFLFVGLFIYWFLWMNERCS